VILPEPYYQDSVVTLYCADCKNILPLLPKVDLVLTDPPYGIGTARHFGNKSTRQSKRNGFTIYEHSDWDESLPDPELMVLVLTAGTTQIIWGANHFANLLPPSSGWLVWDKMQRDFSFSDGELAWTNFPISVRKFKWRWMGMLQEKAGRDKEERSHLTQKPVTLMKWCIGLVKDANLILDPFCGSGTTLVAAKQLGRKAIGVEISEAYCKIAVERLKQEILI